MKSSPESRALNWLKASQREDGGVLASPNQKNKIYPYTEITGYYTKVCLMYDEDDYATRSANYIVNLNNNGFLSWDGNEDIAYVFDTMICADALLDMWEYSYQEKYFNAAHQMVNRIKTILDTLGHLPAMFDSKGSCWNNENLYYTMPGAHYIKLMPIFERFDMSRSYLNGLMHLQRDDGAFHCHPKTRYVFSHFHAYALDGIEKYFPAEYEKGAAWAAKNLMPDGRVPAWSSDRSWSMPGANIQCAYHLHNIGMEYEADLLMKTVYEDQLEDGSIPIRTGGESETWPTIFLLMYNRDVIDNC